MPSNTRRFLLAACALAQLACAESVAPRMRGRDLEIIVPDLGQRGVTERAMTRGVDAGGPQGQTDAVYMITDDGESVSDSDVPAEFETAPSILSSGTDAGFGADVAWGQAHMSYYGSHARQELTLLLRFNNSEIAKTSAVSEQSDWLPAVRSLWTDARLGLSKSCGHALDASSTHSAWHEWQLLFKGLLKWGLTTVPSGKPVSQPDCPPENDGGGGGGGGGGNIVYVCYCLDYFDSATGQWAHGGIIYCLEA